MELRVLLEGLPCIRISGRTDLEIGRLRFDSRMVKPGDLFVAMRRPHADGHRFVEQAVAAGAVAVVLQEDRTLPEGITGIQVADSCQAMALLAGRFYGNPAGRLLLVGVTGTNGKTTVAYLCRAVLGAAGWPAGLLGTVEYQLGKQVLPASNTTPESEQLHAFFKEMVEAGLKAAVMEVSSHALATGRIYGLPFRVGIFTSLGRDHLDFHATQEAYLQAKALLFRQLDPAAARAVINIDDPAGKRMADVSAAPVLTYGLGAAAEVRAAEFEIASDGITCRVETPVGSLPLRLGLRGRFNLYNALAAAGTGLALGLDLEVIRKGLEAVRQIPGRFESVECGQPFVVLVDYAHTPDALENVLQAARQFTARRLIAVFGCGGDRDPGKRPQMGALAGQWADLSIITSDNPRTEEPLAIIEQIRQGISPQARYAVVPDRRQAILEALDAAGPGDTVLIAGKGHEDYQIVGRERLHFDDRETVRQLLGDMGYRSAGESA